MIVVRRFLVLAAATILAACAQNTVRDNDLAASNSNGRENTESVQVEKQSNTANWWENLSVAELNEQAMGRGFNPNIYFSLDSAQLTSNDREKLQQNVRFLRDNPTLKITLEGHCDERGTAEYNLALGERRANTTSQFIQAAGIAAQRIRTLSYGEERPVCTESTEACWARNRRAYFVLGL